MYLLISFIIFTSPFIYGDSIDEPTLTHTLYESMSSDMAIVESEAQIIYTEYLSDENYGYRYTMHLYGNGTLLLYGYNRAYEDKSHIFYLIKDINFFHTVGDYLIDNGILESESRLIWYWDDPPRPRTKYLITLRIGEYYCTLEYTQEPGDEEPGWIDLVEYIREFMSQYRTDENKVSGKEYFEIKDQMEEIYGIYVLVWDSGLRKLVEETEEGMSEVK